MLRRRHYRTVRSPSCESKAVNTYRVTPREQDVAWGIAEGKSNQRIGDDLGMTAKSCRARRAHHGQAGVWTRTGVAVFLVRTTYAQDALRGLFQGAKDVGSSAPRGYRHGECRRP